MTRRSRGSGDGSEGRGDGAAPLASLPAGPGAVGPPRSCGGPRGLPVVSLGVALVAALLSLAPEWSAALAFDRAALARGEWWRLVTGHLAHVDGRHLAYDAAMLAALGAVCEAREPARARALLAAAALAVSLGVLVLRPDLGHYRGLSGIAAALFVLALARARERLGTPLTALLAAGFLAKLAFEAATGLAVFTGGAGATGVHEVVVEAHLVGGLVGLGFAVPRLRPRPPEG